MRSVPDVSSQHPFDDRLLDLFDQAITGNASADQLRELNECLAASPESLRTYGELAALHADLAAVVRLSRARQLVYSTIRDQAARQRTPRPSDEVNPPRRPTIATRAASLIAGPTTSATSALPPRRLLQRPFLAATAASVAIACLVYLFSEPRHAGERPAGGDVTGSLARSETPPTKLFHRDIVAYVAEIEDPTWTLDTPRLKRYEALRRDQVISIDSGRLHIQFVDGARTTLAGPAELVVRSEWSADLRQGLLSADVPAWAAGFTINAPDFRAVDRGTSFALSVEEDSGSGALVLEGAIDIDRRHLSKSLDGISFMKLRQGDAVWVAEQDVNLDGSQDELVTLARNAPPVPRPPGVVVANYRNDFLPGANDARTESPGWRYLCNRETAIGDPTGYRDLLWDGRAHYDCNGIGPHPAEAPFRFLSLSADGGHPGLGNIQPGSAKHDLFAIAAYEVPRAARYRLESAWILARDWQRWSAREKQDLEVIVHVNDRPIVMRDTIGIDGFVNFDCVLDELREGDVIYVAVGPYGDAARDSFTWNFTIIAE
jgi:hypothetical protein